MTAPAFGATVSSTLSVRRGDTTEIPFAVTNPDGSPYNLTGCDLQFLIGRDLGTFTNYVLVTKSTADAITVDSPATAGTGTIKLLPGDTSGLMKPPITLWFWGGWRYLPPPLSSGVWMFDWALRVLPANGDIFTVAGGKLALRPMTGA